MVFWSIAGLSVVCAWIWSLLFILEYLKKENRTPDATQKPCSEFMVNSLNTGDSIKEEAKTHQLILHSS